MGRLWLGSATEIHPAAKLENVLAMWDEIYKYGYYEAWWGDGGNT
jgi:hypothetical protein